MENSISSLLRKGLNCNAVAQRLIETRIDRSKGLVGWKLFAESLALVIKDISLETIGMICPLAEKPSRGER